MITSSYFIGTSVLNSSKNKRLPLVGGPPPSTQLEWWNTESTAAGVTAAYDFRNASVITNGRHIDGTESNVVQNAIGGILGNGCLHINVPSSAGANAGSWRGSVNTSYTLPSQGYGNNDIYIFYRIKLGPNRLRQSNGGGGFKTHNVATYNPVSPNSSNSNWSFEHVLHTNPGLDHIIEVYRQDGAFSSFSDPSFSAGYRLQTGLDWGASLPDDRRYSLYNIGGNGRHSYGLLSWKEGVWISIKQRIRIASPGGTTGNQHDLWVAFPWDTTWTQLYNDRNYLVGGFDAPYTGGINGVWLLPYDTSRVNADYDTWHEYDQLICSSADITCPPPLVTLPTWANSWTDKTWKTPFTNTVQNAYTPSDAGSPASGLFSYSSGFVNPELRAIEIDLNGGHGDNDWNGNIVGPLDNPTWIQARAPGSSSGGTSAEGIYGNGQPRSSHTLRQSVYVPNSGIWMAPLSGTYVTGQNSARYFKRPTLGGNWTGIGYHPSVNPVSPTSVGDAIVLGATVYDSFGGRIIVVTSQDRCWQIDPTTGVSSYIPGTDTNSTNFPLAAAIIPERRALVVWDDTNFQVFNLTTGAKTTPTLSGTRPNGAWPIAQWHKPSGGILCWGQTSGTTSLYKLTPPSDNGLTFSGGTWTFSTIAVDASNTITPRADAGGSNSVITGGIIEDFFGLRQDLLLVLAGYTNGHSDPVYAYKIPKGGV